jgi:hypothetical protein
VTEPEWKQGLDTRLTNFVGIFPEAQGLRALTEVLVMAEIEAAYQRGVQAGRSQREYGPRTRRKQKEAD